MPPKSFFNRLKRLDAYAKTLDDFRIRTTTGAVVTLISTVIIGFLVMIEVWSYLTPVLKPEIVVDGGKMEKLPINFDITFPNLPCHLLSLDVMDESGQHISNYEHDVFKVRLDEDGKEIEAEKPSVLSNPNVAGDLAIHQEDTNYCGPCYGAAPDNECCNTCEQVKQAYAKVSWAFKPNEIEQCIKEGLVNGYGELSKGGCRMYGHLLVNKLRGNFHFSPGPSFNYGAQHVHDVRAYLYSNFNFKHTIDHLQFGDQTQHQLHKQKRTKALALTNPLDGTKWGGDEAVAMHQYFLKIVPTQFDFLSGQDHLRTFQYSVNRQERSLMQNSGAAGGVPGVFFHMDFSPMRVIYTEERKSLASVLVSVCAIVGGIFTVASIVDGFLYKAASLQQKNQMGKSL
ncbi:endoplasmic reticulum vesicle transporter-domain-containing protein [Chlamydoabsidia padenii]|nr:endoplasmic reticulum vesicle transporter-domain-containing protein [Chlamydoabsidia padenii]